VNPDEPKVEFPRTFLTIQGFNWQELEAEYDVLHDYVVLKRADVPDDLIEAWEDYKRAKPWESMFAPLGVPKPKEEET